MNARTFAASFFPGADSTPLETSTANGRTCFPASALNSVAADVRRLHLFRAEEVRAS